MTANLRVGSLASGCGALDLALQQVLPDAELAWVCENDRHASTVLAARFPGVPNLNDVTAIDHTAPPVDILIGGLPCQPYSVAGKQKGKADNRDLLPESIRLARLLEPRLIFLENVSNLVRKPEFRALAGGMAEIGYDIRWTTLRASDVGACHRRDRLFAVAYPHSEGRWEVAGGTHGNEETNAGRTEEQDHEPGSVGEGKLFPTPSVSDAKGGSPSHRSTLGDMVRHGDFELLVTPTAWLGQGENRQIVGGSSSRGSTGSELTDSLAKIPWRGLPTPTTDDAGNVTRASGEFKSLARTAYNDLAYEWGQYATAIERHEALVGTPPPEPVDDKRRLNPAFVEWMMCLPAGWVTDIGTSSPGFTGPIPPRTAQLKILGNAVVPPQAAEAYRRLLNAAG